MEQDSGKLLHERNASLLDLNRAGSALMEIVSEPDMRSADEAVAYVTKLARLLQYIGTCDADLSRGNLRMDVNVSVAREETIHESLGTRCEIKNLNSLVRMRDAIEYEVDRHIEASKRGEAIVRETRGWDTMRKQTFSLRDKEAAVDYRYMRDGDLPRVLLSDEFIASVAAELRETPSEKVSRYCKDYSLSALDAEAMALDPSMSRYFDAVVEEAGASQGVAACNWISHELLGLMHAAGMHSMEKEPPVSALQLASILTALANGTITWKQGKLVIRAMFDSADGAMCLDIVRKRGWNVVRDVGDIAQVASQVIAQSPSEARSFREGDANRRQRVLKFFMGAAMKATSGKADPEAMRAAIEKELEKKD